MATRKTIAVIRADAIVGRMGLPAQLSRIIAGRSVMEHTLTRVEKISGIEEIVLVCGAKDESLLREWLPKIKLGKPVTVFSSPSDSWDMYFRKRVSARKWAMHAWRGGLGGATCHDELLPALALHEAMEKCGAESAVVVGGDWMLVDPALCQRVLALHLENPESMQMTFSQAPPGLCGIAIGRDLLRKMAENPDATFGHMLGYNPTSPQSDAIGRDVCVQIDGAIRSCAKRFIADMSDSLKMLERVADELGEKFHDADALTVTRCVSQWGEDGFAGLMALPQEVVLELAPWRMLNGPVLPQHYATIVRDPMPVDLALKIIDQLGNAAEKSSRQISLTLGGLGDVMLHPHWERIVRAANDANVFGIHVETDLLLDRGTCLSLLDMPVDVISVHLNADTAKVYEAAMGADHFALVIENFMQLMVQRGQRMEQAAGSVASSSTSSLCVRPVVPWLVPRLVKTAMTITDMETFFDRWMHYAQQAVIDPFTSGCGLAPELSPVNMAGPRRKACRQIMHRMTIHADGKVALCDQDWLARGAVGDAKENSIAEIWAKMNTIRTAHVAGKWDENPLCAKCHEWHRP